MTENEIREKIKDLKRKSDIFENSGYATVGISSSFKKSAEVIEILLNEIQQYRAIGTIDEFKALKEKSEPKKPEVDEFDYGEGFVCGECESFLHYVDDDDEHIRTNYCCHCGTKIDWQ